MPVVSTVYAKGALRALPAIARRTASNPDAYTYLAESIADWPAQEELPRTIRDAG